MAGFGVWGLNGIGGGERRVGEGVEEGSWFWWVWVCSRGLWNRGEEDLMAVLSQAWIEVAD